MINNIIDHCAIYEEILNKLNDKKSKELLSKLLLFRLYFANSLARDIKTRNTHYFDEELLEFTDSDIIIDAGGFVGDTLEVFLEKQYKFKQYHLFEPTNAIEEAKKVTNSNKVFFHKYGLSAKNEDLAFNLRTDNGKLVGVSQIDQDGKDILSLVALDSYLNEKVSYIKMDIEGSEIAALEGSRNIIKKYHPKLAICAYHKIQDIIDIFKVISQLGEYKFYMRAERNNLLVDYVIYAV